MRDDLQIIDVFERLKSWLLAERPQLADECVRRLERFEADHSIRYYKERFLAALSGVDVNVPSRLRELSRAVRKAEEEPDLFEREMIGEEAPPFYTRLSRVKRKALMPNLQAFEAFGAEPREAGKNLGRQLRGFERLAEARNLIAGTFPAVKGLDVYRVLKAWDYPVVMPDGKRQSFFYRLGILTTRSSGRTGLKQMADLGESIHRLTGEPLQSLDLMSGAFSGAETGMPRTLARCAGRPQCDTCPIVTYCVFFKYRQKPKDGEKHVTMKDWDTEQRPRERLMRHGATKLNDAELLAILFRTGSSKATAMDLAHGILGKFDGLKGIDESALSELCKAAGVGPVKATTLKAALELGKRLVREQGNQGEFIHSSFDLYMHFRHRFIGIEQEQFHLLCLNTKHEIIWETMVSQGSLSGSMVHPREAFKDAIRHSAASVAYVHNHPSGDPTPSERDVDFTRRLRESSKILGIPLLDHVIVGLERYYSFQDGREIDLRDIDGDEDYEDE